MIVDKKNNLNIYKEDTRKVEKDKETSESCCSSDDTKTATPAACCGSTQDSGEATLSNTSTSSCCGMNNLASRGAARNVMDIDFNEWVGESIITLSLILKFY